MPFSPNQIIIWTFEWIETKLHPNGESLDFIDISDAKKPIAWNYRKTWRYYFVAQDNYRKFSFSEYKKWDPIIMIADYNNGEYEEYFAVYEIWKLIRESDGTLNITNEQWYTKDWWKSLWRCGNYKPDNVMDKQDLLNQIAYFIDVWVPLEYTEYTKYHIFYYISWAFLIDKFIQGKWEIYIWIWLALQALVFVVYWFLVFYIIKFIKKLNKKKYL